jgi:hypothetical protein
MPYVKDKPICLQKRKMKRSRIALPLIALSTLAFSSCAIVDDNAIKAQETPSVVTQQVHDGVSRVISLLASKPKAKALEYISVTRSVLESFIEKGTVPNADELQAALVLKVPEAERVYAQALFSVVLSRWPHLYETFKSHNDVLFTYLKAIDAGLAQ